MADNLERVTAFARDIAEVVAREVQDALAVGAQEAADIGLRAAQAVCDEYAGLNIYVPMGMSIRIAARDQAMLDDYVANGRDAAAIARKYGLSIQTAYKRLRMVEAATYAQRQPGLFDRGTPPDETA